MTSNERTPRGRAAGGHAGTDGEDDDDPGPRSDVRWLVRQRVLVPDPLAGYLNRPLLERRCEEDHRLTLLVAPGGFGKTALLAQHCRALRKRGVAVAWLSVDDGDGADALATYLGFAFEQAGVEMFDRRNSDDEVRGRRGSDEKMHSQAVYRIDLLIRTLERHASPCLLALDELEQLRHPQAMEALNSLLRYAPANLRFAFAMREVPPGLHIANYLLEDSATTVTTEDLRFSVPDIARFFDRRLSHRELRTVAERSAGWPLALRIYQNGGVQGPWPASGVDAVGAWIESRLWRGMSDEDRDLILDLALFDWFDGRLVDEVLGTSDSEVRINSMRSLAGLLRKTTPGEPNMRLHPLIKDYCFQRRRIENPERARTIHLGIARALARRGQAVDALRHAAMTDDVWLAGSIAEDVGALTESVHHGAELVRRVAGMLRPDVYDRFPRLGLARCAALSFAGELDRAEAQYRAVAEATGNFRQDREGGDDQALATEHSLLLGLLHTTACRPRAMAQVPAVPAVADWMDTDIAPELLGTYAYGLCVAHVHLADFDGAGKWAEKARAHVGLRSHLAPRLLYELGSAAMAQGRADAALAHYNGALDQAKGHYLRDSGAVEFGRILKDELALERRGVVDIKPSQVSPRLLGESAATFQIYAASLGVAVQWALCVGKVDNALAVLEEARDYALRSRRPVLAKFVSALRVRIFLADHKVADAEKAWEFGGLPRTPEDCLDLRRGWRQMEELACTRIRLCIARDEHEEASVLAQGLMGVSAEAGLKRTLMRAKTLSLVLARRTRNHVAVAEHLESCVDLYAESNYAGPLTWEGDIGRRVLDQLAEMPSPEAQMLASKIRRAMKAVDRPAEPALTEAELDVLLRLAQRHSDKKIAVALNLSVDGVRYRLRRIFSKLNADSRFDAVHRARARGILPA